MLTYQLHVNTANFLAYSCQLTHPASTEQLAVIRSHVSGYLMIFCPKLSQLLALFRKYLPLWLWNAPLCTTPMLALSVCQSLSAGCESQFPLVAIHMPWNVSDNLWWTQSTLEYMWKLILISKVCWTSTGFTNCNNRVMETLGSLQSGSLLALCHFSPFLIQWERWEMTNSKVALKPELQQLVD